MRPGPHSLYAAALGIATLAGQLSGSHGQSPPSIPATEATALTGRTIRLPQDLPPYALLVLGCSEKSSSDSAECGKRLQEALPKQVDAKVFQVPVWEGVPRLVRGFVTRSIPDVLQSTFIPVLDHEAEWKRPTGSESPEDAYILLTGLQGRVLWRTHGPCSAAKVRLAISELGRESRAVDSAP